jgi:hypothetical protein
VEQRTTSPARNDPDEVRGEARGTVGLIADLLGIATFVAGTVTKDRPLIVLSAIALCLLTGSWFWRRRPVLAVSTLALGCLITGAAVMYGFDHSVRPPASLVANERARPVTPSPPTSPTSIPAESGGTTATTTPTPATTPADPGDDLSPKKLVDENIVLPRNAAIDVDKPDQPAALDHRDGAVGDYDLYHDWAEVQSDAIQVVNAPNAYPFSGGNLSRAYFICKADLEKSAYPSATGPFCFTSSQGHLGYAIITQTRRDDQAFVVHVVVWDGTGR